MTFALSCNFSLFSDIFQPCTQMRTFSKRGPILSVLSNRHKLIPDVNQNSVSTSIITSVSVDAQIMSSAAKMLISGVSYFFIIAPPDTDLFTKKW